MSDYADIVRDWLALDPRADWEAYPDEFGDAVAALDALVAERDRLRDERDMAVQSWDAQAKKLEAERDEAVEMSRQMVAAYELAGEETDAAEAEVARLQEELEQHAGCSVTVEARWNAKVAVARAALGEDA
jgi:hypothetical protein